MKLMTNRLSVCLSDVWCSTSLPRFSYIEDSEASLFAY